MALWLRGIGGIGGIGGLKGAVETLYTLRYMAGLTSPFYLEQLQYSRMWGYALSFS